MYAPNVLKINPVEKTARNGVSLGSRRTISLRVAEDQPLLAKEEDHRSAECYRALRTRILHHPKRPKTIIVSSPGVGDGKTLTTLNLAGMLALKKRNSRVDCGRRSAPARGPQSSRHRRHSGLGGSAGRIMPARRGNGNRCRTAEFLDSTGRASIDESGRVVRLAIVARSDGGIAQ
jgi:hypothetical protein